MHILTPQTILGILLIVKELFMSYVRISGSLALITLSIGILGTLFGVFMLFIKPRREYIIALTILALLPLLLGMVGTTLWSKEIKEAAVLEKMAGKEPSAAKYYDLEYAYSKFLISWFPAVVGVSSSIPPFIFLVILKRRRMYGILSKEGGVE